MKPVNGKWESAYPQQLQKTEGKTTYGRTINGKMPTN